MKVLFIGGTGVISSACSELALARGIELYLLNRGESARPAPAGAHVLHADIRDRAQTKAALAGHTFDAVVDWVAFTPEHIAADIEIFRGRTAQYVFISSASVYEKPPSRLPITESTPLSNPFWTYAANKIACEELLQHAYHTEQFPATIVRPSHTYDRTKLPTLGYYTAIARMRAGKPTVVHGDGTSLWVMTHHQDFAVGFVGLLGNHACGRRGVPHHVGRVADVEPDLHPPGPGRRRRAQPGTCAVRGHRPLRPRASAPACWATRRTA